MSGKYTCAYIHNSGNVCGRVCRCPEGCHDHWRAKKRVPCNVCGKPSLLLLLLERVKNMPKEIMLSNIILGDFSFRMLRLNKK